jgi:hypothetical protein
MDGQIQFLAVVFGIFFFATMFRIKSWDSSVSIVTEYGLDDWGSNLTAHLCLVLRSNV